MSSSPTTVASLCRIAIERGLIPPEGRDGAMQLIASLSPADAADPSSLVSLRLVTQEQLDALLAGPDPSSKRTVLRHRRVSVVAAGALLVAAALLITWVLTLKRDITRAETERNAALLAADRAQLEAHREAQRADREREATAREAYFANIQLADRYIGERNFAMARGLLESCPARLRHWEWGRLHRLCHLDLATVNGHMHAVDSVAFSPDGKRLASGDARGTIKFWDIETRREVLALKGHEVAVRSLEFSPDVRLLASTSYDGTFKHWDTETGLEVLTLKGWEGCPWWVPFWSPDKRLVADSTGKKVRIWDGRDGRGPRTMGEHPAEVCRLIFSPDGKQLMSSDVDGNYKRWDTGTGREVPMTKAPRGVGPWFRVSRDGTRVAAALGDESGIKVWDPDTGKEIATIEREAHEGFMGELEFSGDGKRLACVVCDDRRATFFQEAGGGGAVTLDDIKIIKIWDAEKGREVLELAGHDKGVMSIAFSPDGELIASGDHWGTIKLWETRERRDVLVLKSQPGEFVSSLAFSPDGRRVTGLAQRRPDQRNRGYPVTTMIWDAGTGRAIHALSSDGARVVSVAYSPDGKHLAAANQDGTVTLWDAHEGKQIRTLQRRLQRELESCSGGHEIAFSSRGDRLASAGPDGVITLWDTDTGRQVLKSSSEYLGGPVALSPDTNRAAAAGWEGIQVCPKLWDPEGDRSVLQLKPDGPLALAPLWAIAFSPDGKRLASSSGDDATTWLWDAETGRQLLKMEAQGSQVQCMAFSPDGKRMASGRFDRKVKLWDTETGKEVLTLTGSTECPVYSVAFSPDGKRLASAGGDGAVKIWEADEWREGR